MNKYILGLTFISSLTFAQVAIGKSEITNEFVSLEFGYDSNDVMMQKGIILPWVTSAADLTTAVPGTMIFDLVDKKIKYKKSSTTTPWGDLTYTTNGEANTAGYTNVTENPNAKVIIKTQLTFTEGTSQEEKDRLSQEDIAQQPDGILVLGDTNKAMILPQVINYKELPNPSPGTIVFDVTNQLLCTFNGKEWTFCKAEDLLP